MKTALLLRSGRLVLFAVAGAALACGQTAKGTVIFNNFDAGGGFHPQFYSEAADVFVSAGSTNGLRAAAQFTVVGGNFNLSSITLPISVQKNVSGNFLRVRLASDAAGVPGPTLEVLSANQGIWPAFSNPFTTTTTLPSLSHPLLANGQKYWIVTEPTSVPAGSPVSVDYRWFVNTSGALVLFRQENEPGIPTDPWSGNSFSNNAAFRVDGVTNNAPLFTNCPASTNLGCNPVNIPGCNPNVGATGACGGTTVTCASSDTTNGCAHTRTSIYTAVDSCNHSNTCTQVVTWTVDTTPPVLCVSNSGFNLVPNSNFETYTNCPQLPFPYGHLDYATPWFSAQPGGTPDLFNSCAGSASFGVGVPQNLFGTQSPHDENGYAGFFAYFGGFLAYIPSTYREYIETRLSSPLVAGQTYDISFYVSLSDASLWAVDNVGAFLSANPATGPAYVPLAVNPQVQNPPGHFLSSKTDWVQIKGTFTGTGVEKYLTIGNFFPSDPPPLFPDPNGGWYFSYYYVDSISVTPAVCCASKIVECGSRWSFDRPTAQDDCCTNIIISLISSNLVASTNPCQYEFRGVWRAIDCCSNSTTCTQTVYVVDTIAPSVCCQGDFTVYTCSNQATVKWKAPRVTDNCTVGLQATCYPPSGSPFPIGTTTVSCSATDACGKVGSCGFNVTVVGNQLVWASTTLGVNDCYKAGNETASVPKSAALTLGLPGSWKLFDETTAGKRFGASFLHLTNNIQCAQLWLRMKPNCLGTNSPQDDTLSLGFTNYPPGPSRAAWTNYIGSGNSSAGLINNLWCQQTGCAQVFSLDLANLPNGGANLLPLINSNHRLDILVEDATTVDYVQLCYCYCPSRPLWHGLEWDLGNATFLRNCFDTLTLSRDTFTNFNVGLSFGGMRGISFGLNPLSLGDAPGKSIVITGQRTLDELQDSIRVAGNGAGVATFSLAALRTNVAYLQVTVRNGTNFVSQSNLPLTLGTNLLTVTGNPLLTGIGSTSAGSAYQFTFESSHPVAILSGSAVSGDSIEFVMFESSSSSDNLLGSLDLEVAGVDEIEITDALVQAGRLSPRIQGDAVAAIAGDVLSISSLDLTTNNPVGFITGLGARPTDPIWILPTLSLCRVSLIGASVTGTVQGYLGNDPVPFKLGDVRFVPSTNGWSISEDFANIGSSSTRYQVLDQGAVVVDTGNSTGGVAEASDLPDEWRLSAVQSEGLFIFNWPDAQTFTVNGNPYSGDELRLLPLGANLPAYSPTLLSVLATGVESLALSTEVSDPVWRMQTPVLTPSQMTIQWDGPSGGTLESAPTVFGPWTNVPGQIGNSVILGSPLTNGQPAQFFRVRSN